MGLWNNTFFQINFYICCNCKNHITEFLLLYTSLQEDSTSILRSTSPKCVNIDQNNKFRLAGPTELDETTLLVGGWLAGLTKIITNSGEVDNSIFKDTSISGHTGLLASISKITDERKTADGQDRQNAALYI